MATRIGPVLAVIGSDVKGFTDGLTKSQKQLQQFSATAAIAGARASAAFAATIGAMSVFVIKVGADFELAMSNVRKTVELAPEGFAKLEQSILDMSTEFGIAGTELANFARIGGQLGIDPKDLDDFTASIAKLSIAAVELDPETAARGLARIAALTKEGSGSIEKMANVLAKLGDSLATDEGRILNFSERIASFSSAVGLSSEELLGLAAGFSALVGGTEKAATAVEKFLAQLTEAVAGGGSQLEAFAETASLAFEGGALSAEDFSEIFATKPMEAINLLIGGMETLSADGLAPLLQRFDELGITGVRMLSTFAAAGKGADTMRKAFATAAQEALVQSKLQKEVAIQLDTVVRQFDILKESVKRVGIELFKAFRDEIMFFISAGQTLIGVLQKMAEFVGGLGSVVQFAIIGVIGLAGALSALLLVLGTVGGLVTGLLSLLTKMSGMLIGNAAASGTASAGLATYGVGTGAATAGTTLFTSALGLARVALVSFLGPVTAAIAVFAATFTITSKIAGAFRDMEDPVNKAASELGAFGAVVETVKSVGGTLLDFFTAGRTLTDSYGQSVDGLLQPMTDAANAQKDLKSATDEANAGFQQGEVFIDPFTESIIAMREAARTSEERLRTIAIASALARQATGDATFTFETLGQALLFLSQQQKVAEEAQLAHVAALDKASVSGSAAADSMNDTIAALIASAGATERVKEVAKGLGLSVDDLNAKMGTNREEFLRLAEVQIASAEATKKNAEALDEVRQSLEGFTLGNTKQEFDNFATIVRETMTNNVAMTDKGVVEMVKRLRELADTAGIELPADLSAFGDAVDETVARSVAVAEAFKAAKEELQGMSVAAAGVKFEGFQKGLVDAIATGEKFSIEATLNILKTLKEGAAQSGQEVVDELKFFMAKAQLLANIGILIPVEIELPDTLPDEDFGPQETPDFSNMGDIGGLPSNLEFLEGQLKILNKESTEWNQSLAAANDTMKVLGISADSAIGGIIGGLAAAGAAGAKFQQSLTEGKIAFARLKEQAEKSGESFSFGDFAKSGEGLAAGIQTGSALLSGAVGVWEAGSAGGIAGALGGAVAGAQFGAQVGEMFGPIGAVAGAAIGAGIGVAISLLRGKAEFVKIMEEVGEKWGVEISEELAKEIEATAERLDLGRMEATLLSLSDVMAEAGGAIEFGLDNATTATNDLMNAIASGAVPAAEGIEQLSGVFSQMASELFEAGTIADAALLQIIERSRELGIEVPEIAAFIADQLAQAAAGITQIIGKAFEDEESGEEIFGGIQVASLEDAQAQATIFAAGFFAMLDEVGLREAVDTFGPAFDEMKKKLEAFGGDVNFGGVEKLFKVAQDPKFGPLLDGLQGLKDGMTGLGNAGFLTAETFGAFQQQGLAAFDQMQALGLSSKESLQQMAPFLQEAINASQTFGFTLDEDTQKLIDQAEAAGIGFSTDPMTQMVDVLALIAEQLGVTQEALSGVGVGAEEAGAAVDESLGGEVPEKLRDEWGLTEESVNESYRGMSDGAQQAADDMAAAATESATEAAAVTEEAAMQVETTWDENTIAVGTKFDEMTDMILTDYQIVIDSTAIAGEAVAGLGENAISAASGFDQMAQAAREAAAAARSAGSGDGGPPSEKGQFGLTATVNEPTSFIAGEAGEETVTIDPGGGGAPGGAPSVVVLQIDGKTIGKVLGDLSRTGDVRIHPSAVKDFG